MPVFADYARYYNLLYRDKDYAGETSFALEIFKKQGCVPGIVLDLGCGTGRHALEMSKQGITVTGVDISKTMLNIGQTLLSEISPTDYPAPLPKLRQGDARTVRLNKKFDAVVSLFHVMSYQNSEEDALAVMKTARMHLKPGGLFIFDFWYGPGVLTDPPKQRKKIMEDGLTEVIRKVNPVHRVNDNVVEVHYIIDLIDRTTGLKETLSECHLMRYWFLPELCYLVRIAGLIQVNAGVWMKECAPDRSTWNAWLLALAPKE